MGKMPTTALKREFFSYVEGFYNRRRRHSSLGDLSPDEFERRWEEEAMLSLPNAS